MFDVYARSFLEATRFTQNTRPAPHTQRNFEHRQRKPGRTSDRWMRGHHVL